jgi:hypothetical protein
VRAGVSLGGGGVLVDSDNWENVGSVVGGGAAVTVMVKCAREKTLHIKEAVGAYSTYE